MLIQRARFVVCLVEDGNTSYSCFACGTDIVSQVLRGVYVKT